ncbi:MAG: hypothetical protein ACKVOW_09075 [Chitinophagaceae bacterium]
MLTITSKTRKAGKFVNTEHTDTIIRNYKQERWVNNSKHIGKEDSLSVWYSAEELEQFLERIKLHGADGVRFYFGAYGKEYTGNPLYAGRQTIVMVATQGKETQKGIVDKDVYINTEKGNSILAYNVGKLCPPICKPNIFDDENDGIGITIIDKKDGGLMVI